MSKIKGFVFTTLCPALLLISLCFLCPSTALAGDLKFIPIDFQAGFHQSRVDQIFQDSRGFMWFGTTNGLMMYDGYHFTPYTHSDGKADSLSENTIRVIYEDREQNLWVGVKGCLEKLDRKTNGFIHHRPFPGDTPRSIEFSQISESRETPGRLWLATMLGLWKFDKKSKRLLQDRFYANETAPLSVPAVNQIIESVPGILWLGTSVGLYKYDLKQKKLQRFRAPDLPRMGRDIITTMCSAPDAPHLIWAGTYNNGLLRFDCNTGTFTRYKSKPGNPDTLCSDKAWGIIPSSVEKGVFWVNTFDGINRFDSATGRFSSYRHDPGDRFSLTNNDVLSLFQDKTGVLWVGTARGGLNRSIGTARRRFHHYIPNNIPTAAWHHKIPLTIYEMPSRPGTLWVGTYRNINRINLEKGTVSRYRIAPGKTEDIVTVFYESPSYPGVLWSSNHRNQLLKLRPAAGTYHRYQLKQNSAYNTVTSIIESPAHPGLLWLGRPGGICRFDPATGRQTVYDLGLFTINNRQSPFAFMFIHQSPKSPGYFWLGHSSKGLLKFQVANGIYTPIPLPVNNGVREHKRISAIHESPITPGFLWLASSKGLLKFDIHKEKLVSFPGSDELAPYDIRGIDPDDDGNLWLGTQQGLVKYSLSGHKVKCYDLRDGLQNQEFLAFSNARDSIGTIYKGCSTGVTAFHPLDITDNRIPPPVVITGYQVFTDTLNNPVNTKRIRPDDNLISLLDTPELTLSHADRTVSISFTALDYMIPSKNKYAYRLNGFDKSWNMVSNRRTATYTGLPSGDYTFQVVACNNDGVWNNKGASIMIHVTPPWWNTNWAQVSYILIFIGIVFGAHRIQRMRLLHKAHIIEAQLRVKVAESQAKALESEHKRKTHELEEARKIQLSMLPAKIPNIPDLEISVYMKTATEVGGDYYDFFKTTDGVHNILVGDATGHGLKAGTMVSIIKGIFLNLPHIADVNEFFMQISRAIKKIGLGNLFMALALVRFSHDEATIVSAGMPPIYLYRAKSGTVEEVLIKAPPIGAFKHFDYRHHHVVLEPDDVMLILSDGLPEQFNKADQMFGYQSVSPLLTKIAAQPVDTIIDSLNNAAEKWADGEPQNDDMTFVVLKFKGIKVPKVPRVTKVPKV